MRNLFSLLLFAALALAGCGDDADDPIVPQPESASVVGTVTITTPAVTDITTTTATVRAQVSATQGLSITGRGFCYATTPEPTTADLTAAASINDMLTTLTALQPATTYYVRGYAVTASGTTYSDAATFTTESSTTDNSSSDPSLDDWTAPTYADDYRSISTWAQRSRWNLANVHDPTVVLADDGYYYMYQTDAGYGNPQSGHGHFMCRRSKNLVDWEFMGATMTSLPAWVRTKLNEIRAEMGLGASTANMNNCGYWAPCVRRVNSGLYRMYYVITIDGTIDGTNTWGERAFIGLMETANPADVNSWQDKGYVITNYSDRELNFRVSPTAWQQCYYKYNAIDPSYIITPEGEHWLIYGSWHSGFAAVQLSAETGKPVTDPLPNPWGTANETAYGKRVFTRENGNRWQGAEAPEVVYHDGYYYMFLAYDALEVPYNTRVVRSTKVDGPYQSITGTNVTNGGDALPIMTHPYKFADGNGWVGISHCAVFDDGQGNWYYASQGRFPETAGGNVPNAVMLGHVRSIRWTDEGWPIVMPERYAAVPQTTITESELVGQWENITLAYDYGKQNTSVSITLADNHRVTGLPFSGQTWSFDQEKNILTVGSVKLYLQRECDWEASPRCHTIVYAGFSTNGQRTYWGKKK